MHKIIVLLAIQPRMLAEVVGGIVERQPDMDTVGEVSDPGELGVAIQATGAQVLYFHNFGTLISQTSAPQSHPTSAG